MSPLEILKKELEKTALSAEDKAEFFWFLSRMPGRYIIDIIDMAREDPKFLDFLWSNYSKKEKAFVTNDKELADEILEEEKVHLDEMNRQ